MLDVEEREESIRFVAPSTLEVVEEVVGRAKDFLCRLEMCGDSSLILILRELMINAIEHGNLKKDDLTVTAEISRVAPLRFKVEVADEGEGFDSSSLDMSLPDDPSTLRNRGLALVNSFADQLLFNEKGNVVMAYITLREETGFEIGQEDDVRVVKPSGDLTAAVSDKFREILIEMVDQENEKVRFDFEKVEDIDSVALSVFVIFAGMITKKYPDCELTVVNANKDIVNVFQLTRMNRIFQFQDN